MSLPRPQIVEQLRNVIRVARFTPFDTSSEEGRSLERYRRIVLSTGASIAGTGVSTLVGLVLVPLLLGYLGRDVYGLWATLLTLVPWVSLLDLGFVAGLVVAISEANGRDDRRGAQAYFSTAFLALTAVSLLSTVVVVAGLAAAPWDSLLPVPPGLTRGSVAAVAAVVAAFTLASLPLALVPQVLAGYQASYVSTAFSALGSLLSLALVYSVTRLHGSLLAIVAASSTAGLLATLGSLAYLLRRSPWMRPERALVSRAALRRLFATAFPLYLFQLGSLLVNQTQRPILAARAGLSVVTDYDLLLRVYGFAITLITVSSASVAPSLREAYERGEVGWMRRAFWHLVRVRLSAAAAFCVLLLLAGNLLLRLWLRRPDFQYGIGTWLVLCVLLLASIWASSFLELMTILDRIWPQVAVVLAQGAATVLLTWWLCRRLGVQGGLLAITVPALAFSAWMLPVISWRLVRHRESGARPPSPGTQEAHRP
jgi:O-antigen/teichoic acid export membrane protein